jgi:hypothetical protein
MAAPRNDGAFVVVVVVQKKLVRHQKPQGEIAARDTKTAASEKNSGTEW